MSDQSTAAAAGTIDLGGDLTVNRLGFGAMRITGQGIWGDPPDHGKAIETLRRAVELGVNFIDTADSYGPEVSEKPDAEGAAPLPGRPRHRHQGRPHPAGPESLDARRPPRAPAQRVRGQLRRLRVEQIALYQLHAPDPNVPYAESVGTIAELQKEGKIRHVGVSNVSEEQLREAQRIVNVVSVQNRYNVTDRSSQQVLDLCEQESLVFLPWAPIQQTERNVGLLAAARRLGATEHQVVLAWLLASSPAMLPIPGTGSPGHAAENIAAASIELSGDEVRAIRDGG